MGVPDRVFNRIYEQRVPVLATSNKSRESLQEVYPSPTFDRMLEWDTLELLGTAYRSHVSFMDGLAE